MTAPATLGATVFRAMVAHTKPAHNDDKRPRTRRQIIIVKVKFMENSTAEYTGSTARRIQLPMVATMNQVITATMTARIDLSIETSSYPSESIAKFYRSRQT